MIKYAIISSFFHGMKNGLKHTDDTQNALVCKQDQSKSQTFRFYRYKQKQLDNKTSQMRT
jgi:hypothetical protein